MNNVRAALAAVSGLITLLATGCDKPLDGSAFLARYERECAVSIQAGEYRFILLYESPDFLAVSTAGASASAPALDSASRSYRNAQYVRLSIRPIPRPGDEIPGVMESRNYDLDRLLREVAGGMAAKIRLDGPDGKKAKPVAVSILSGTQAGSANTLLIAFPAKDVGGGFDPPAWQLVVDEFGLNLGTIRSRLAAPKGFRLKVAT